MTDYIASLQQALRDAAAREYPAPMSSPEPTRRRLGENPPTQQARRRSELNPFVSRRGGPRRAARWFVPALALAIALVVAAVALTAGSGPSIVARAYAATSPAGVIVHYVETTGSLQPNGATPLTSEIWTYGNQSHQIIDPHSPKNRQDIVARDGRVQTLAFDRLSSSRYSPADNQCSATSVLEGCVLSENNSPIAALRALYRSGLIHATGHTTVDGHRVDVLTGQSRNLTIRALIDQHTLLPAKVTMTVMLRRVKGGPQHSYETTITDYRRLPVTTSNLRRLTLPPHPHARLVQAPCRTLYPGCAARK
ncbi:MAG TPA: hypothetical protein VG365_14095 [Solirubrobacteraceae bacterium]|nr:hypothetical protein [Solirubrobacteraceae bacterium]